jgi:sec-independent protein translocase protein TatC
MSFWEHLDELRGALVRGALAVLALTLLCFAFAARLQDLLTGPFTRAVARVGPGAGQLALLGPTEGLLARMKIALGGGLLLGGPWALWQLWRFVAPGLHAGEKRLAAPVAAAAGLLFLAGAAFGYRLLELATFFLLQFSTPSIGNQWSLSSYLSFAVQVMGGLGLVFQLPLVLLFLVRLGLVSAAWLARRRRHAAVAILIVVALLPMQDPFSLVLMSAPLYLLYETSIHLGRLVERRRARRETDAGGR